MPTTQCPHAKIRPELPALTARIAKLPVDDRGYPVPFFVQWLKDGHDGPVPAEPGAAGSRPEFRVMDGKKWARCYKEELCWVCGERRSHKATFVIGPMCAINRTSSEMPCHYECAVWSVQGCPFLSRPNMVRREDEEIALSKSQTAGIPLERNPGVSLLWTSNTYQLFRAPNGLLMNVGEPIATEWWREGRRATRAEILESINSGVPKLMEMCEAEEPRHRSDAYAEMAKRYDWVMKNLVPAT